MELGCPITRVEWDKFKLFYESIGRDDLRQLLEPPGMRLLLSLGAL